VALLVLANLAVWMGFFTPIQVLLPDQIQAISPAHKEAMLSWVTGIGALAAVVANPLAGALSDRTAGRFGRRHPWTLGGGLLGAAALVLLSTQHSILGVIIAWVLAQVCFNAMLASLTAAIPDRVPVEQRGAISGWVGIPQVAGVVLGTILVTTVVTGNASGYLLIAVLVVVLTLPFPLSTVDDRLAATDRRSLRLRDFWVSPREHPDFAWAFGTRFLVQLGNALGTLYLLYYLRDRVHYADPESGLALLIVVYALALTATTVVTGWWSDRTGKRKRFVIASGVVMTVAALMLAVSAQWTVVVGAAAVLGAGYGIYLAVDAALITQVLPSMDDRAKDLGVVNIANSAPQVLGPAIAGPIVATSAGYPTLYVLTAVVTLLGGVFVYRIRSVS
jgi:MFS family permease